MFAHARETKTCNILLLVLGSSYRCGVSCLSTLPRSQTRTASKCLKCRRRMAPPAKKVKGPSAYMMFSEEHRPHVQARLRAEAADGKVPITVIAKALGELWKSLTEEKQQEYRHKAHQRAADAAAAAEGEGADAAAAEQQQDDAAAAAASPAPAALPKHLVKKIMLADDEVQRVSADALWLVAEAAALFLQQLATKAAAAAAAKKRKTIQLPDFEHVVRCDKRLVEAGLKDVVQNKHFFELHGVARPGSAGASKIKPHSKPGTVAAAQAQAQAQPQDGSDGDKENKQEQQQQGGEGADKDDCIAAAAEDGEQLTDEQRIALEEQKRKKAEAAGKLRAAKAAEKKVAREREAAKGFHKISIFFASNKPDTLV